MSLGKSIAMGAASGAAAGSIVPGWGTVIGGVIGAGVGTVKGLNDRNSLALEEANANRIETDNANRYKSLQTREESIRVNSIVNNTDLNGGNYTKVLSAFGNTNIAPIKYKPELIKGAQPISSDASVINGPSHEEGGVPLNNVSSDNNSEMEGNEVIIAGKDGNPEDSMIFSARLTTPDGKTFAQTAADYSQLKGTNEEEMVNTIDKYKVDTLERENEIVDVKIKKLFELQGMMKQQINK